MKGNPKMEGEGVTDDNGNQIFGIGLSSEAHGSDTSYDVPLGAVLVPPNLDLGQLRIRILHEIPTLPARFQFISPRGWPITSNQERAITVRQISTGDRMMRIQHVFEKPRVGIKTTNGSALGFVFINHSSRVSLLRDVIHSQLGQLTANGSLGYQFIDRNRWPISADQESLLSIFEVLSEGSVTILPTPFTSTISQDLTDGSLASPSPKRLRLHSPGQLTFTSTKDQDRQISVDVSEDGNDHKQVLISYVRAEAAQHALNLKCQLVGQGFTVYLDVHEIKSGIDWQDSLNYAVSNCEVFVPLITSRYGETQWTNREVKLADVLNKVIIPINFLDHWPPRSLAIQFSTTQYIPWKSLDAMKEEEESLEADKVWDVRYWPQHHVKKVAQLIGEKIKLSEMDLDMNGTPLIDTSPVDYRVPLLRKKSSNSINFHGPLMDGFSQRSLTGSKTYHVVISVHPSQEQFGMELKALFQAEGYSVWCSSEVDERPTSPTNGELNDLFGHDGRADHSRATIGAKLALTRVRSTDSDDLCLSQPLLSSQMSIDMDPKIKERQRTFQEKAVEAGVVVVVLSKAFACSKMSQQQVFYCEHRKRVIPIRYDEFCMPTWMSMLIGTGVIEDVTSHDYKESLLKRVKSALDPESKSGDHCDVDQEYISNQVKYLKEKLPKQLCIYIAGSSKFYYKHTDDICTQLGEKLSLLDNILLVTGGFVGVGDTVGTNYHRKTTDAKKPISVWHILPERDYRDRSHVAKQRADKTFEPVAYGHTVFSGNSVREREIIAARVFDICILIEGGPGAAHEAEQFIWNDHIVIPIRCTGGAAGGKFNVPKEIFEIPPGVSEVDWNGLSDQNRTPSDLADCVTRIIECLRERLKLDSPTYTGLTIPSVPSNRRCSPRKRKTTTDLSKMSTFMLKSPSRDRKLSSKDRHMTHT